MSVLQQTNPQVFPTDVNSFEGFLRESYQYICIGVQAEALIQASRNNWRNWLCGSMMQNGWNTQLTLRIQQTAIHAFRMELFNVPTAWQNIQATAEGVVTTVMSYACGLIYESMLQNGTAVQLSQQDQQSGALALNKWRQLERDIGVFVSRNIILQPQQQRQAYGGVAVGNPMTNTGGGIANLTTGPGNLGSNMFSSSGGSIYPTIGQSRSRYDDLEPTLTPEEIAKSAQEFLNSNGAVTALSPMPSVTQENPIMTASVADKPMTLDDWTPGTAQSIFTAYHLNRNTATYAFDADGDVIQSIVEKPMDYKEHLIPGNLKDSRRVINPLTADRAVTALEAVAEAAIKASDPLASDDIKFVAEEDFIVSKDPILATTYADAWLQCDLARVKRQESWGMPSVFRAMATIANPFLAPVSHREFLSKLEQCNDIETLNKTLIETSVTEDRLPSLWRACLRRATAMCNRAVRQNLSVTNVKIENVIEDYDSLVTYLVSTFGKDVYARFYVNQARIIRNSFGYVTDEQAALLDDKILGDNPDEEFALFEQKPTLTYLTQKVTLTYLNIAASTLAIEMSPGRPALVKEKLIPAIYNVAKHLFTETPHVSEYDRHFIRTTDNVTYELSYGWMPFSDDEPAYIITLVS